MVCPEELPEFINDVRVPGAVLRLTRRFCVLKVNGIAGTWIGYATVPLAPACVTTASRMKMPRLFFGREPTGAFKMQ